MDRFTKTQLMELCKKRNLPTSGLKKDLVERLQKATQRKETVVRAVLQDDGSLCHAETGFVFDAKSKRVIGRRVGSCICSLNRTDIAMCNQYRLLYDLPETLEEDRNDVEIKPTLEKADSDFSDYDEYQEDENEEI